MTQTQHTSGPWRTFDAFTDVEIVTDRPTANETESIVQFKGQSNARANAAFIVRACNSHADLIQALEFVSMTFADMEASERKGYLTECPKIVAAALAKAEGQ
jgi:pyrroloquinoline quinone (PQQ) biosynthesis protein C